MYIEYLLKEDVINTMGHIFIWVNTIWKNSLTFKLVLYSQHWKVQFYALIFHALIFHYSNLAEARVFLTWIVLDLNRWQLTHKPVLIHISSQYLHCLFTLVCPYCPNKQPPFWHFVCLSLSIIIEITLDYQYHPVDTIPEKTSLSFEMNSCMKEL